MNSKYKEILLSLIPALIFLIMYKITSFKVAVISGLVIGTIVYISKYKRNKSLSSFDYLGIFGLLSQTVIGYLAKKPMTYFVYPLIENLLYMIIFSISLLVKKDAVSFLAKDYVKNEEMLTKLQPAFRKVSLIWAIFFGIKALIKIVGMTSWSFELLYSINWLMGAPLSLLFLWFSFTYPDKYYVSKYGAVDGKG
jgi:intracellular septation protein A